MSLVLKPTEIQRFLRSDCSNGIFPRWRDWELAGCWTKLFHKDKTDCYRRSASALAVHAIFSDILHRYDLTDDKWIINQGGTCDPDSQNCFGRNYTKAQ